MARLTSVTIFSLFAVVGVVGADKTTDDYIYWRKADIMAWHQYFPARGLAEELLTNRRAAEVVAQAPTILWDSMVRVVQNPSQEVGTAFMMMEGTNGQQCVDGIVEYLVDGIKQELANFGDCIADLPSILDRINKSVSRTNTTYQSVYQSTLTGINNCASNYPNRDSQSRLMSCVDTYSRKYYSTVSSIYNAQNSPSMAVFTNTFVRCAVTAVQEVVKKGFKLLNMLGECSKLSENIDTEAYEKEIIDGFYEYLPPMDIPFQISQCQGMYTSLVSELERKMMSDYYMKRSALQLYIIEPKYFSNYTNYLNNSVLHKYREAVTAAAKDFLSEPGCVSLAHSTLNDIVIAGAESALKCDENIVNATKDLLGRVDDSFASINYRLLYYGNAEIIATIGQNYIFADNTIKDGYNISLTGFQLELRNTISNIDEYIARLKGFEASFYSSASLPCADRIVPDITWQAKKTLYALERCLYKGTAARYAVTTPPDTTITTTPTTTTTDLYN